MSDLYWIDLETTGLDYRTDKILEIYVLITNRDLEPLVDPLEIVIHYSEEELKTEELSPWIQKQHGTLLELVRRSSISLTDAQKMLGDYLDKHRYGKKVILAGSSVYFDRNFLQNCMPAVMSRIHHRTVDVTTLLELARRWHPQLHQHAPRKTHNHRARDDVHNSLELLKFYRCALFQPPWAMFPQTYRPPTIHSVYI